MEASDREFLEGWQETMVRSPSERAELDTRLGQVCPYWDRKLKYNKKEYRRFVKELGARGFIEGVTSPLEFAAFFWKQNMKDRRLIVDARLANRAFRDPPGVRLLSSDGLGRMEWHGEKTDFDLELAVADIDNCFHRYKMPKGMC